MDLCSLPAVLGQGKSKTVAGEGEAHHLTYQELSATCGANYCPVAAVAAGENVMEGDHGQKIKLFGTDRGISAKRISLQFAIRYRLALLREWVLAKLSSSLWQ